MESYQRVEIKIYDLQGKLVRDLVSGYYAPAEVHQVVWDSRDNEGLALSSGVYFSKMIAGDFTLAEKMILLK